MIFLCVFFPDDKKGKNHVYQKTSLSISFLFFISDFLEKKKKYIYIYGGVSFGKLHLFKT